MNGNISSPHPVGLFTSRRAQPTRATYQVRYEVRKMGAIGVFEIGLFVVDAYTINGAMDVARAEAHSKGYECRFPVSVVRVQP